KQNNDRYRDRKDESESNGTERQQYSQSGLGAVGGGTERIESEGWHAGSRADTFLAGFARGKRASKNRVDQCHSGPILSVTTRRLILSNAEANSTGLLLRFPAIPLCSDHDRL